MNTVQVTFLPSGITGHVPQGTTVLRAALKLEAPLRHVCGGQANCTTCRVRLESGRLSPPQERETRALPEERFSQGFRLGCQARLLADTVVRVPSLKEWLENLNMM